MNNFLKILVLVFLVGSFTACEDNIEVVPQSALDGAAGFKTKQDVDAALIGCYSALTSGNYMGLRTWALPDVYADNLIHTGTFPSFAQIATRNILPNNAETTNMWQQIYTGINRANTVIASAPAVTDPSFNANNAIGEARFLRAYHYFHLLTLYGGSPEGFNKGNGVGVPLITTPTLSPGDAAPKARNSEAEVWALILEDLNFAVDNLANSNGRANKFAATAMRARVHLFRGEWAQAEADASAVLANTAYRLTPTASYSDIWLKKNTAEAILELQFDNVTTNAIAFFYYPTSLGGRNEINSSTSLRDAHEAGDIRKDVNFSISPAGRTLKYTRVPGDDNVVMIRLAEMYLIRAEAAAQLNKGDAAQADLNAIRARAGLAPLTLATTEEILNAILQERRLEFAHEGHRWTDLRRANKVATVGITQDFRALWPIPEREVLTSGSIITQNTGY